MTQTFYMVSFLERKEFLPPLTLYMLKTTAKSPVLYMVIGASAPLISVGLTSVLTCIGLCCKLSLSVIRTCFIFQTIDPSESVLSTLTCSSFSISDRVFPLSCLEVLLSSELRPFARRADDLKLSYDCSCWASLLCFFAESNHGRCNSPILFPATLEIAAIPTYCTLWWGDGESEGQPEILLTFLFFLERLPVYLSLQTQASHTINQKKGNRQGRLRKGIGS